MIRVYGPNYFCFANANNLLKRKFIIDRKHKKIIYGNKEYYLPYLHFNAIEYLISSHIKSYLNRKKDSLLSGKYFPKDYWIRKKDIIYHCFGKKTNIEYLHRSLKSWFVYSGGKDTKRFYQNGCIQLHQNKYSGLYKLKPPLKDIVYLIDSDFYKTPESSAIFVPTFSRKSK